MSYQLLDSGEGEKFERFGDVTLIRPSPQALWRKKEQKWHADGRFTREKGWELSPKFPESWQITLEGILFKLKCTSFGHLGIFPEQAPFWRRIAEKKPKRVLNLFAYSGGSSLAAARVGAHVTHVDASKPVVTWAKENADLNGVSLRWIVEDVRKYVKRAVTRGELFDGIIIDPPTFGRGASGELFKIEEDLLPLLKMCTQLLSDRTFFLLTCHTPGITALVLQQMLSDFFPGDIQAGEMLLEGPHLLPSGSYAFIE